MLNLAYINMEGNANRWFKFWRKKVNDMSWEQFAKALILRFGKDTRGNVFEWLTTIKQKKGIDDYIQEFEVLIAQQMRLKNMLWDISLEEYARASVIW